MSKKNRIIQVETLPDGCTQLHTLHFSVAVNVIESPKSEVILDYTVIRKTSYTTTLQVKKFLQKVVIRALKEVINRHKEIENGRE